MTRVLLALLAVLIAAAAGLLLWTGRGSAPDAAGGPPAEAPSDSPAEARYAEPPALAEPQESRAALEAVREDELEQRESRIGREDRRTRTIRLRVTDQADRPFPGATVGVVSYGEDDGNRGDRIVRFYRTIQADPGESSAARLTATDEAGRAELRLEPNSAEALVFVRHAGFALIAKEVELREDELEHDLGVLKLRSGALLRVEVVDQAAQPIPGALVTLSRGDSWRRRMGPLSVQMLLTGEDGVAAFPYLAEEEYLLAASRNGFAPQEGETVRFEAGEQRTKRIVLDRGRTIDGVVLDADGRPAPGVQIEIEMDARFVFSVARFLAPTGEAWAVSGKDGRFSGGGLEEGESYTLTAERVRGFRAVKEGVRVGDSVTLRLPARLSVTGRLVFHDGQPAAEAKLAFLPHDAGPRSLLNRDLVADPEGRFELECSEGRYDLAVWHERGEHFFPQPFEVRASRDLGELRMPVGGDLEVKLLSAADGAVLRGSIQVSRSFDPSWLQQGLDVERVMGRIAAMQEGRGDAVWDPEHEVLRWTGLSTGRHFLVAQAPGFADKSFTAHVEAGPTATMTVEMEPGAKLVVVALLPDGSPAPEVSLFLRQRLGGGRWEHQGFERTDDDGEAVFEDLPPGSYVLNEDAGWFGRQEEGSLAQVEIASGENRVEVRVDPRFELHVQVLDSSGPVAGAEVQLVGDESDMFRNMMRWGAEPETTDEEGRITLPGASLGTQTVIANRPGGYAAEQQVEVLGPGQHVEVLLHGASIRGVVLGGPPNAGVSLERIFTEEERKAALEQSMGQRQAILRMTRSRGTRTEADAAGVFAFHDLPPGSYALTADVPGYYQIEEARIEIGDASVSGVELLVEREGRLAVSVSGLTVGYRSHFRASVVNDQGQQVGQSVGLRRNERHEIRGVPPGTYTLKIQRFQGREREEVARIPVSVDPNRETVVEWDASQVP